MAKEFPKNIRDILSSHQAKMTMDTAAKTVSVKNGPLANPMNEEEKDILKHFLIEAFIPLPVLVNFE